MDFCNWLAVPTTNMNVLPVILAAYLLALTAVEGQDSSADKAFEITQGLYITLRNIAFPGGKLTDDENVPDRFLLLMPGKVLNYADYNPGKDYINFINVSLILIHHCILCASAWAIKLQLVA